MQPCDFAVIAALQAPRWTLHDAQLLKHPPSDAAFVTALLDEPTPPKPALDRAERRHAEFIRSTP